MNKWTLRKFGCELLLVLLVIAMLTIGVYTGSYLVFLFLIPVTCSMVGIDYYEEKE